jgi:hypothetical protein
MFMSGFRFGYLPGEHLLWGKLWQRNGNQTRQIFVEAGLRPSPANADTCPDAPLMTAQRIHVNAFIGALVAAL